MFGEEKFNINLELFDRIKRVQEEKKTFISALQNKEIREVEQSPLNQDPVY